MASGTSWLKGCGIGCGLMVILAIVGTIGGGVALMRPFKEAIHSREILEETFGTQEDYRPPPDGIVPIDRLEIFIAVRADLMEHCEGFDETFAQFRRMEELDEQETSGGKKFREVVKTVGKAFGLAGKLGKLAVARNEVLAAHGMGLGEYSYIYALTYYAWLDVKVADPDGCNVEMDDSSPRVRQALRGMLRHQLEDLEAADRPDREVLRGELEAELLRLGDDHDLYPWQRAVPERIAASLAPCRGRLEAVFCRETAPFELSVHRQGQGGLSIRSD
ncbi:hypothetical protein KKG45_13765 [bacterium]|nr:hypothetical protein [bacterium]MBU1074308.1 hypothetical protein [bacterium]MBU1677219.1 hypothetical protein [bacterium]